ncbi:hypothetical protein HMPREF2141_03022 [Bacteroides uniformis]|nr:hypothetical protein HMPREF2141_03022 [Bacteroides uniformis]
MNEHIVKKQEQYITKHIRQIYRFELMKYVMLICYLFVILTIFQEQYKKLPYRIEISNW